MAVKFEENLKKMFCQGKNHYVFIASSPFRMSDFEINIA